MDEENKQKKKKVKILVCTYLVAAWRYEYCLVLGRKGTWNEIKGWETMCLGLTPQFLKSIDACVRTTVMLVYAFSRRKWKDI